MDKKTIGIVALAIIAVGLLAFSFKNNFMTGPRVVGREEGMKMGEEMKRRYQQMEQKGAPNSGGAPVGTPQAGGAPGG
jgi:hypothetical protein